jgi:hypothetical protein
MSCLTFLHVVYLRNVHKVPWELSVCKEMEKRKGPRALQLYQPEGVFP